LEKEELKKEARAERKRINDSEYSYTPSITNGVLLIKLSKARVDRGTPYLSKKNGL
jgi:hypothetical protein